MIDFTQKPKGKYLMNVFIGWSGKKSRRLAEVLHEWLPLVNHNIKPWMSSEDVSVGQRWSAELSKQLQEARFGIFCVTPENIDSPWLNFECGAISKIVAESRVCPYLFGLNSGSIGGPLSQFQGVTSDEEGTRRLVEGLNDALGPSALANNFLSRTFSKWWPELSENLKTVSLVADEVAISDDSARAVAPNESLTSLARSGRSLRLARSTQDFRPLGEGDFSDYLRRFVSESPTKTTVKILNIDGVELFGSDVSGVTELYLPILRQREVSLRVLLMNPTSAAPLAKRQLENAFRIGDRLRYEPNEPDRIYRKILSSCRTLADYIKSCPDRIECRFMSAIPSFSVILRDGQGVCILHSPCHKGWDSPILLAGAADEGLYSFWEEYFDFTWDRSSCESLPVEPNRESEIIARYRIEFEQLFQILNNPTRVAQKEND